VIEPGEAAGASLTTVTSRDFLATLSDIREEWDALLGAQPTPFLTAEWLTAWSTAFGVGGAKALLFRDAHGCLTGGACVLRRWPGRLFAAENAHTGDWDVLAATPSARAQVWTAIAALKANRVHLRLLPRLTADSRPIVDFFREAGYRVVATESPVGPRLSLPGSWPELLAALSRNHRSQLSRKRRALEKVGRLTFRTNDGTDPDDPDLLDDLQKFLAVEGSGWKGRAGTAISSTAETQRLYLDFARAAATRGWLRLHFLEVDGDAIAADLECTLQGGSFLIKTGFAEQFSEFSPGLVLRGEVLRSAIERGCSFYDFMGLAEAYKLRWGAPPRQTWTIDAFKGPWRVAYPYHARVRPILRRRYHDWLRRSSPS
jgi:CelD/BcsL family acetyltransferase involved in cellulose biosynthesis